jgi:ethanolamine kinase
MKVIVTMTATVYAIYPPRINVELDPSDMKISGPRLVCSVKSDWVNKSLSFEKLTDGLSNKLLAMFPQSKKEQGLIFRVYGNNSDLIIDREAEIETMVRLSQLDMSNKVLLTFNNGFIYAFVPGEQIDINDQTIKWVIYHLILTT